MGIKNTVRMLSIITMLVVVTGCSSKALETSASSDTNQDPELSNPNNPYSNSFKTDLSAIGSSGSLNATEASGLNSLSKSLETTNPQAESLEMSSAMQAQLEEILKAQGSTQLSSAQIQQLAQLKSLFLQALMQHCSAKISSLAPQPGEPMIGDWTASTGGTNNRTVGQFRIRGEFQGGFQSSGSSSRSDTQNPGYAYPLGTGKLVRLIAEGYEPTKGVLNVTADGNATMTSQGYSSKFTDSPRAAAALIYKSGVKQSQAVLTSSKSFIPEKYVEAMKEAGQCYRIALFMLSPAMDQMARQLPSNYAQLIKTRMLGLQ